MVEKSLVSRQEAKIRELESKLEFEKTQVKRLEVSVRHRWGHVAQGRSAPGRPGLWKIGRAAPEVRGKGRAAPGRSCLDL